MSSPDLLSRIRHKYGGLSKNHKRIADYILNNYDKVAFMTASSLGKKLDISESTVVRFASAIGYAGYPKLQKELQDTIKTKLTTVQRYEISKTHTERAHLSKVMMSDIDNIRQTLDQYDTEAADLFIDELIKAKKVYILGLRSSFVLAHYFGFYLNFILPHVHVIHEGAQDVYDQMIHVEACDALVVFSFPRYSKRTYDCVDYAIRQHTTILGVTDSIDSPLFSKTTHCLTAKYSMSSFIDSFVAPMSLLNSLITGLSLKKEGVERNFEKLEDIWEQYNIYGYK